MLVSFSAKNWMSFRERTSFTMVASKERQHGDRVPRLKKYQTRVLPVAAIYGGNASGKTNFFKALSFCKTLVVRGTLLTSLIPVEPFRLDSDSSGQPSEFTFEILIAEVIYEFSFVATRKAILEEKLTVIGGSGEKMLYHRQGGKMLLDRSLEKEHFLQFVFQGTRDNQLFLTNSVSQKVEHFRPVYDWFNHTLELVAPDSRFEPFEQFIDEDHPCYATMHEMLSQLDTGIAQLGGEQIPFENIPMPEPLKARLQQDLQESMTVRLRNEPGNERYVVTRKGGELIARKLVAFHPKNDGARIKFDMRQESDGSQRVIDLLPAFLELSTPASNRVYVIDEVDRSLHTLLTRSLLEKYLAGCSADSRKQLLFTTHDVLLMDQQILRRDEMWVTEKDSYGASRLFSFSEYKDIRYDKDIRKSYLQGRLGGIPRILLGSSLPEQRCADLTRRISR